MKYKEIQKANSEINRLIVTIREYAEISRKLSKEKEEIQEVAVDMMGIIGDINSTEDEVQMAAATLWEALNKSVPIDLETESF